MFFGEEWLTLMTELTGILLVRRHFLRFFPDITNESPMGEKGKNSVEFDFKDGSRHNNCEFELPLFCFISWKRRRHSK